MAGPHKAPRKAAPPAKRPNEQALALQVALDKAGFSPGEIDGRPGAFTSRALDAFKAAHGLAGASGAIDQATITALGDAYQKPLTKYTITAADVQGPFEEQIPQDMVEKAKLKTLGYSSALEELAERFHAKPDLLTRLNPNAQFLLNVQLWYFMQHGQNLKDWKNTVDGCGNNLLDFTCVPFLTEVRTISHERTNMPAMIIGGKQLGFLHDRYVTDPITINQLWGTIAQAYGGAPAGAPFAAPVSGFWAKP